MATANPMSSPRAWGWTEAAQEGGTEIGVVPPRAGVTPDGRADPPALRAPRGLHCPLPARGSRQARRERAVQAVLLRRAAAARQGQPRSDLATRRIA